MKFKRFLNENTLQDELNILQNDTANYPGDYLRELISRKFGSVENLSSYEQEALLEYIKNKNYIKYDLGVNALTKDRSPKGIFSNLLIILDYNISDNFPDLRYDIAYNLFRSSPIIAKFLKENEINLINNFDLTFYIYKYGGLSISGTINVIDIDPTKIFIKDKPKELLNDEAYTFEIKILDILDNNEEEVLNKMSIIFWKVITKEFGKSTEFINKHFNEKYKTVYFEVKFYDSGEVDWRPTEFTPEDYYAL